MQITLIIIIIELLFNIIIIITIVDHKIRI